MCYKVGNVTSRPGETPRYCVCQEALVLEHVSVPGQTLLEVHKHLVSLLHRADLDPGLQVCLLCELEHVPDVLPGSDQATDDLQILEDQAERGEAGQWVVGCAELDECAVDVQQLEVLVEREGPGHSGDDKIERCGVVGHPCRVLASGDELIGTKLESVILLAG
jgi:hypothetical protein